MQKANRHQSIMRVIALTLALLLSVGLAGSVGTSAQTTSQLQGTSVSLGSELIVNFYAEVVDTEGAVMTFTVNGAAQTVPVAQARYIEENLYSFPCTLAPAQMTETIQATLTDSGNTFTTSTSVRDYAAKLVSSKQWDKLAAVDMMVATLHYGAAAQSYFGYRADDLANAGYTAPSAPEIPESDGAGIVSGRVGGITFYGASLVFESRVAVRFYFTVSGNIEDYTFSTGDAPVLKNDLYYVEVPGINPQDYSDLINLTVSDGTSNLSVTYSPMYYISRMYEKTENENLKSLISALYQYHLTAVDYLADPYGNDEDNLVSAQ